MFIEQEVTYKIPLEIIVFTLLKLSTAKYQVNKNVTNPEEGIQVRTKISKYFKSPQFG